MTAYSPLYGRHPGHRPPITSVLSGRERLRRRLIDWVSANPQPVRELVEKTAAEPRNTELWRAYDRTVELYRQHDELRVRLVEIDRLADQSTGAIPGGLRRLHASNLIRSTLRAITLVDHLSCGQFNALCQPVNRLLIASGERPIVWGDARHGL